MWTDPPHPLISVLGNGPGLEGAPWFCDAAVFARGRVPAVACGPGFIAQAHTKDEWIAIDELGRASIITNAFYNSYE